MPKKTAAPTLEELWELEDKVTAFVGRPTGAKHSAERDETKSANAEKSRESFRLVQSGSFKLSTYVKKKVAAKAATGSAVGKVKKGAPVPLKEAKARP